MAQNLRRYLGTPLNTLECKLLEIVSGSCVRESFLKTCDGQSVVTAFNLDLLDLVKGGEMCHTQTN